MSGIEFFAPYTCNLCLHMKHITLANIYERLETFEPRVETDPGIAEKARLAVERMLSIGG